MNTGKEFVSQVVDEIERRKRREHLRNSMSDTAYYIDKIDKQIEALKSKIEKLTKKQKWWNKWYLSKRINKYRNEIDELKDNMAFSQRALDATIRLFKKKVNEYDQQGTTNL